MLTRRIFSNRLSAWQRSLSVAYFSWRCIQRRHTAGGARQDLLHYSCELHGPVLPTWLCPFELWSLHEDSILSTLG